MRGEDHSQALAWAALPAAAPQPPRSLSRMRGNPRCLCRLASQPGLPDGRRGLAGPVLAAGSPARTVPTQGLPGGAVGPSLQEKRTYSEPRAEDLSPAGAESRSNAAPQLGGGGVVPMRSPSPAAPLPPPPGWASLGSLALTSASRSRLLSW